MSASNLMNYLKTNWKSTLVMFILLGGLGVGVYLVQQTQIFSPKAASDIGSGAFDVYDRDGNLLQSQGSNTYNTNSTDIRINLKDINALIQ